MLLPSPSVPSLAHADTGKGIPANLRRSSSLPSSANARKTSGPRRQIPHCELVSETVSKIRWKGDRAVTRKVNTSATAINCTNRRFAIV